MNKILYLFLLGTCLVKATSYRGPQSMPTSYMDGPTSMYPSSSGAPKRMPSSVLTSGVPAPYTASVFSMTGQDSDEAADTSSQVSTDIQDEMTGVLDNSQEMSTTLDLANMRFDSGKKIYYPSKGYKENTITLLDLLSRTRVTKNKKTGQYVIKITIDPIWAPTDIITMPKDELEKQLARKQKRTPQQARRQSQRKSRARVVTPNMEATPNIRMRDIGGLF